MKKSKIYLFLITASIGLSVIASTAAAQKADNSGWTEIIELNEQTSVFVSYKVEKNAIKLKYEWEYSRYRGSTHVFHDLVIGYQYSYGSTGEKTHSWIAGKAVVKGWTKKAAYASGTDDKGRPAKDPIHTAIVTIPINGGTAGFGTNKKFCWNWTSERYGTEHIIKPEEGIVYKACTPAEKDDYGSDAPPDPDLN